MMPTIGKSIFAKLERSGALPVPAIFFLIAIALTCWEASYSTHPGPKYYYNHFPGLEFATALAFDALQCLLFITRPQNRDSLRRVSRILNVCRYIYWAFLAISGLICAICYGLTPKPDATAIQVLILLNAATPLMTRAWNRIKHKTWQNAAPEVDNQTSISRRRRFWLAFARYFNRLLKIVRFILSAFFIAGAVGLAKQYRYSNQGTESRIFLPSGASLSINYYCTTVSPANSSSLPTIWFEASAAHGITDFLGLQTILAEQHGRNSCTYDPPNFGWSDRWPSSESTDLTTIFQPLLQSIQRVDEVKILAGWGAGEESVLRNAREDPDTVRGVVFLDVAPSGIEWTDQARAKNLSMDETLALAKADVAGRSSLAQMILALGLPWGALPLFIPYNDTGYFDKKLYPRHYAQGMKDDLWAMQYYSILDMLDDPFAPKLENLTLSGEIPVFTIATYLAGTDDVSSAFYRDRKLRLGRAVAGKNFKEPVTWCAEKGCDLGFPVTKPEWTANALVNLGI